MRRDPFQAIADPTRRALIAVLVKKPSTLNKLAENFTISRPAVSKQIKILNQCGLVKITQKGRERHCEADLVNLKTVVGWLEEYRSLWDIEQEAGEMPIAPAPESLKKQPETKDKKEEEIPKKSKPVSSYQYELF